MGIYTEADYIPLGEALLTQWSGQMGRVGPEQPVIGNIFLAGSTVKGCYAEPGLKQVKVGEE